MAPARLRWLVAICLAIALRSPPASAFAHLWDFVEIFSNADGSVQFVEMSTAAAGETVLTAVVIRSLTSFQGSEPDFHFPRNLTGSTANRRLLLATQGFAASPGAVAPDFILPDDFFAIGGDTLTLRSAAQLATVFDTLAFGPSLGRTLPSDGFLSLQRVGSGASLRFEALPNTPTNFAGQTGALVPEPASAALVSLGLGMLAGLRARRRVRARSHGGRRGAFSALHSTNLESDSVRGGSGSLGSGGL
jgi:PEP-CTERM motif-containing protein